MKSLGLIALFALAGLRLAGAQISPAPPVPSEFSVGSGEKQATVFLPRGKASAPCPVVIFLHGWMAIDPWVYGAWIDHLTAGGNIVIHPRYQAGLGTPAEQFTENALAAIKSALSALREAGRPQPDASRVACVGHSVGGLLVVNIAGAAASSGLPAPRAIMSLQAGRTGGRGGSPGVPLADLSTLRADTLLLCVTGDRDAVCGDADTRRLMAETTSIPSERKGWLELRSDDQGTPRFVASHYVPCSPPLEPGTAEEGTPQPDPLALRSALGGDLGPLRQFFRTRRGAEWRKANGALLPMMESLDPPNAYDHALWRQFDALMKAAFTGEHLDDALGRTAESRSVGQRADGTALKPMVLKGLP